MSCKKMESALLAVVDGRATGEERDRVAAHAASCAGCAQRLADFRAVWGSLDALEAVEPSPGFDARLRARMEADSPGALQGAPSVWPTWFPARARFGRLRWAALVAATVAIALWFSVRLMFQQPVPARVENPEDFAVVKNLPVLENYDLLSNFDALSALPGAQTATPQEEQPVE